MAFNLDDYAHTAAQRGWGAGWPSCGGAKAAGTAVVTTKRSGTRVSVHKRVARLVLLLLDWTEDPAGGNYLLKPGQCGGYNCRAISGSSVASNHSWGLALDLNWNDNTFNSTGRHTLPTAVARKWNRYGFAWGGDYRGAKQDWMHLEQMGTPADVDALTQLALDELTVHQISAKPSPTPAAAISEDEPMAPISLPVRSDGRFNQTVMAEVGASSAVVARAWLTYGSTWGATHFKVCALDNTGAVMAGAVQESDVANNRRGVMEIPSGAVMVTVEGHVLGAASVPAAALIVQSK